MSIELGAQIPRDCHVNKDDYWRNLPVTGAEKEHFMDFIQANKSQDVAPVPLLERKLGESEMIATEVDDMRRSVANLKTLLAEADPA